MNWVFLITAGLCEIFYAAAMPRTDGFTRLWPTLATLAAMVVSVALLAMAVRHLPLGTAYAVWTGIGAIGTVLLGIVLFNEPATLLRLGCVALILGGIIGLKILS